MMFFSFAAPLLLSSTLLQSARAFALPFGRRAPTAKFYTHIPAAFQAPSSNEVTENCVTITPSSSNSKRFSAAHLKSRLYGNAPTPSTPLYAANFGYEYLVDATVGRQPVKLILDTGSSDTWVIQKGFQCLTLFGTAQDESLCRFGPVYNGVLAKGKIPDVYFSISYGDGEFLTGDMGFEDVLIAGIAVPQQEIAFATQAYWRGDNTSTGLVGLAYPGITSAYTGSVSGPGGISKGPRAPYDPLFTTMSKKGLSSPLFSMALERNSGGTLAFGGLPPVQFDQKFARAPIELSTFMDAGTDKTFYAITPDALVYGSKISKTKTQYIVDSGSTLVYLPSADATAINDLFVPKPDSSRYIKCNATAPSWGITIGGLTFQINPKDMILKDPITGKCFSGVGNGGSSGPFILGDTFLKNVVAVYDVGAAEMRFAAHDY